MVGIPAKTSQKKFYSLHMDVTCAICSWVIPRLDQIFGKVPARPSRISIKICINVAHGPKLTFQKYFGLTLYTS